MTVHRHEYLLTLALLLVSAGCSAGAAQPANMPERTEVFAIEPSARACPMQVEGSDVVLTFVDGGGAFIFTAATSRAIAVRRAARNLAALYDTPLPPAEAIGQAATRQIHASPLGIPTRVEYSNVPTGARMEVTAIDPRDVATLQQRLRKEADRMDRTKRCQLGDETLESS